MSAGAAGPPNGWLFFLDVVLAACVGRIISYPLYRLRIPRIVGDIIAGCLLGPTVLQNLQLIIFPPENRALINLFGYFGLILASVTSGAAFDRQVLRGLEKNITIFAFLNIGMTFASCYILLLFFPGGPKFHGPKYNSISYNIYFGAMVCATSLPMAFLILDELKLTNTIARFMIGSATLSTILLFTLASIANSFASAPTGVFGSYLALFRIGALCGIIIVLYIVQSVWQLALRREWHRWFWRPSTDQSVLIISLSVCTAVGTDLLGYTYILGAFLAGAFLPSPKVDPLGDESKAALIRSNIPKLVKYVSRWIMLPCFFLYIGLQLDIRYINGDWGWVVLALAWGMAFKMLLIPISMYGLGMSFYDACFAALIGNCRGFNALILAQAGLDAGQFGPTTFAIGVLFSVLSSCLAGWLCRVCHTREKARLERLAAESGIPTEIPDPEPELPLHLAVAPFFGDNTGELLAPAPSSQSVVITLEDDGRERAVGTPKRSSDGRSHAEVSESIRMSQRRALAEVDPEDEDTPRMVHLENGSEILGRQRSLGGKVREEAEPLTNDSRLSLKEGTKAASLRGPSQRKNHAHSSMPNLHADQHELPPMGAKPPSFPQTLAVMPQSPLAHTTHALAHASRTPESPRS